MSGTGRWDTSTRRQRLPSDWASRRQRVLKRDGFRCTWFDIIENGSRIRCTVTEGLEVDHRIPNDDHSEGNLRTLCGAHHAIKTSQEGHAALAANRAEIAKRFRRVEKHPALVEVPVEYIPPWQKHAAQ